MINDVPRLIKVWATKDDVRLWTDAAEVSRSIGIHTRTQKQKVHGVLREALFSAATYAMQIPPDCCSARCSLQWSSREGPGLLRLSFAQNPLYSRYLSLGEAGCIPANESWPAPMHSARHHRWDSRCR